MVDLVIISKINLKQKILCREKERSGAALFHLRGNDAEDDERSLHS